jgi:hypothetical protein
MHEAASACHHHALTFVSMSVDVSSGQQGPSLRQSQASGRGQYCKLGGGGLNTRLTQTQQPPMTVRHMYIAVMSMRCMTMTLERMGRRFRPSCARVLAAEVAMT